MKLNFRHGLISYQSSVALQQFLIQSSVSSFVDLNVSPTPFIATIAHGQSNYLVKFDASIPQAWGPVVPGVDNYFFIDINLMSGQVTRQITTLAPTIGPVAPADPVEGQMWFDTVNTKMMVKRPGNKPWIECVRIIVGVASMGSTTALELYQSIGAGSSQVGLNIESEHGFVLLDELGSPLKNSRGEFLTSMTPVRVRSGSNSVGVLTSPVNNLIQVVAAEPIPEFSVVQFVGLDSIGVARQISASPPVPVGLALYDLGSGEVGSIVQFGEVMSDEWNWSPADAGKPLYVNQNGQLTTTRPSNPLVHRVGFVKGQKSVLISIDSEAETQVVTISGTVIDATAPLTATQSVNGLGEPVTTISIDAATASAPGYMSAAQAAALDGIETRFNALEADVILINIEKANVSHVHEISHVTNLQDALDSKASSTHNHALDYAALNHNHDSTYAPISHTHEISDVSSLQTALNGKAASDHSHVIADVTGLQDELDAKAQTNHTHSMGDISGLSAALDAKLSFENTTPFTPSDPFNPATKQYVDTRQLDDLGDVDANMPTTGDILSWNGSFWVPVAAAPGSGYVSGNLNVTGNFSVDSGTPAGPVFQVLQTGEIQIGNDSGFGGAVLMSDGPGLPAFWGSISIPPATPARRTNIFRLNTVPFVTAGMLHSTWSAFQRLDQDTQNVSINGSSGTLVLLQQGFWEIEVEGIVYAPFSPQLPDGLSSFGVRLQPLTSAALPIGQINHLIFTRYSVPLSTPDSNAALSSATANIGVDTGKYHTFSGKLYFTAFANAEILPSVFFFNYDNQASTVTISMTVTLTRLSPFEFV